MMRSLLAASMIALATAGCAQATQIVIVVDSDLMLTEVDIAVSSTHSAPAHASADFSMPGTPPFPLTLAIYPRSSTDIDVVVTVIGTLMDGTTIERDVQTRFVPGASRMLRVLLAARCLDRTCDAGQSCDETGCRDIVIDGGTLPDWTGSAPSLSGMAACAAVDEICNGEDDDCNMRVDETFDLATDAANCGSCGNACGSDGCMNGFCTGQQIAHIATGGAHTCASAMNGSLTCWGWNDQHQLGTEMYVANPYPMVVAGVMGAASVTAGGLHTCTIDTSGRCSCFGDGQDGELGRGMTLDSAMPGSVSGAMTFATVVAGVGATCAIDASHNLFCWGANDHGQLGLRDTTPRSMPATMVMANVSSVAMGFQHACAITMTGALMCWGSRSAGQIGMGGTTSVPGVPVAVPGVTDATAVACGRDFTCFVHTSQAISCFGGNDFGQLGDGTTDASTTLRPVSAVTDATSISAASAGTHVCAVRATGLLACWGGNLSGQLGDGTVISRSEPIVVTMPADIAAVSTGGIADDGTGFTCALDREGRVWCWGDGALGQLGTKDYMSRSRPTLILGALAP